MLTSKAEYFSFIATFILVFSLVLNCKPEEKMPAREMEKQASDEEVIDVDAKEKGTITGIVKFKGKVPERKKLKVTIDQYACGEEKHGVQTGTASDQVDRFRIFVRQFVQKYLSNKLPRSLVHHFLRQPIPPTVFPLHKHIDQW